MSFTCYALLREYISMFTGIYIMPQFLNHTTSLTQLHANVNAMQNIETV